MDVLFQQIVFFSCKFKRYSNLHLSQLVTSQNNVHPWYVDNRSMFYCILKRWFICIVQTLGDPERRSQYDKFGYTSAKDHRQQSRGSPFGDPFHGDPFEGFFHNFHNFKFNFGGSGFTDSFIEKNEINMRYTLYLWHCFLTNVLKDFYCFEFKVISVIDTCISLNTEECIYYRVYETKILPESHQKPYILYAYAEFCYECVNLEPVLERLFKELESVGK